VLSISVFAPEALLLQPDQALDVTDHDVIHTRELVFGPAEEEREIH
jgi:hypothetical protein